MKRLYLNNIEVDIFDTNIAITKQINNIAELKDSQAHFTNKFKLPFTPKNKDFLEGLGIIGSRSRKPYTKIQATYIDDGEDMIPNGYAIIDKFDGDYHCTIYDGNIFLFEALGNKKLSDLDWSELDHNLTTAQYQGSFHQDWADGYIYAISDFGNFNPNEIIINYQLPSFFIAYVWQKIWQEAGFDYHGGIFNTQKFRDLVITAKRGYDSEVDVVGEVWSDNATSGADDVTVYYQTAQTLYTTGFTFNFTPSQSHLQNGIVTITESANYHVRIQASGTLPIWASNEGVTIILAVTNLVNTFFTTQICNIVGTTWSGVLDDEIYLSIGTPVGFYAFISGNWDGGTHTEATFTLNNATLLFETANTSTVKVTTDTFIGEITQKQFLKDTMQHFGLMMQKRRYSNDYDFIKRNDLVIDRASAEDWSDKFNRVLLTDYKLKNYAQNNRFAYNYRQSDGEKFADGFLEINNETLPAEKTHLTRPYNACEVSEQILNNKLFTYTPFWEANRDSTGQITDWKVLKGKNYLAKVVRNNETINYKTAEGNVQIFTGEVPRLSRNGLDYNTILNENYNNVKQVLDWNNVKTVEFILTKNDVKDVDFFKLKYAKQLASYFILNKIKGYKEHFAKCEIVLVPFIE